MSSLVSNFVLCAMIRHLRARGLVHPLADASPDKAYADVFETLVGIHYQERGFIELQKWLETLYRPLILVARKKYQVGCGFSRSAHGILLMTVTDTANRLLKTKRLLPSRKQRSIKLLHPRTPKLRKQRRLKP